MLTGGERVSEAKPEVRVDDRAVKEFLESVRKAMERLEAEFRELSRKIEEERQKLLERVGKA